MAGTERCPQRNQGNDSMTPHARIQRWTACLVLAVSMTVWLGGCSAVPRRYIWMAEPGVTLTALTARQESYVGKVVLLGGTIIEEEEDEQYLLLRVKNRPLDQDYMPHRPIDSAGPEAGSYWVIVAKQKVPLKYRDWARTTVVGRVTGTKLFKTEPVLVLLYMRGWGTSPDHDGVWETIDPNYVPSVPGGIDLKN